LDWNIGSDFGTLLAWRGAEIAALCAVALMASALLARRLERREDRLKARLAAHWRPLLTQVALGEGPLPVISPPKRRHLRHIMEEWNAFQDAIRGSGTSRLNGLALQVGIDATARRLLRKRGLGARILAIRTLGNLRDVSSWQALQEQLASPNALLSFYAAAALIQIDAQRAMPGIVSQLAEREEWPGEAIAGLLKEAGTQVTREPIRALVLSLAPEKIPALLPWLKHADPILASEVGAQLLRTRPDDPRCVAAALPLLNDPAHADEVRALAGAKEMEVRKEVAIALGRLGDESDTTLLMTLMGDPLWWVRYRAAQALLKVQGSAVRASLIRLQLTDRYARDMLDHVLAETAPQ
jgi:hypothetical protein